MIGLTISRLAVQAEVKPSTVRFYERRGLLPMPRRTDRGYRMYNDDALRRLPRCRVYPCTMPLTVSQLAIGSGVKLATVRFYERRGLLSPPPRSDAGYRLYSKDAVDRVRFIKRAQAVGFTLEEVRGLLSMLDGRHTSSEVCVMALSKLTEIDERIVQLNAMKKTLTKLTKACNRKGPAEQCVIIRNLQT